LFLELGWRLAAASPRLPFIEVFFAVVDCQYHPPNLGELARRYAGKGSTPVLAELTMFESTRE
jgi:hypothetical protein